MLRAEKEVHIHNKSLELVKIINAIATSECQEAPAAQSSQSSYKQSVYAAKEIWNWAHWRQFCKNGDKTKYQLAVSLNSELIWYDILVIKVIFKYVLILLRYYY